MNRLTILADDVALFLRRSRGSARRAEAQLGDLAAHRTAGASRVQTIVARANGGANDLLDELLARDEELAATSEELREQIAALQGACALLERERSKYLDLFAHAPGPYVVTDLLGVTQEANIAAGALLSVEETFLRGRPLIAFVARNDTRKFRDLMAELFDAPTDAPRAFALRMRPRGQPVIVCHTRVAVVRSESGKRIALRWMFRRLDAREDLSGGHVAEAELARMVVDDLRPPLTTIAGWARLLRDGSIQDEDEREQALVWIEKSAAVQRIMLDDLAELSTLPEDVGGPGSTDTIDLDSQARAMARGLLPLLEPERLVVEPATDVALVRADPESREPRARAPRSARPGGRPLNRRRGSDARFGRQERRNRVRRAAGGRECALGLGRPHGHGRAHRGSVRGTPRVERRRALSSLRAPRRLALTVALARRFGLAGRHCVFFADGGLYSAGGMLERWGTEARHGSL